MTGSQTGTEEKPEEALDPATERLRGKLVRFMIINLLVIFGLLIVVVGILVYQKAGQEPETATRIAPPQAGESVSLGSSPGRTLRLQPGETIADLLAEGRRITLHIKGRATERIVQIDIRDGSVLGEIAVEAER
ncbi:hypothetical protein [Notoacmeibacter sp. MSK16QG-6]|uniref:hypothetical protein n=1 Tax=Notoacmeibacter sp. MSK16QG-6 TaxID=2957982 RepID=UPI0020A1742C|nr:hypothetical protein [Notoacmeibacter sp. MSK16QG-6]MCP1200099.1 hypothetical protein [Notoacmeibacter sp. MSK16QG-6]